jgi:hypothetical protein
MVLLKTTLTGLIFLAVGILLVTVIGQYATIEVQQVHRMDIEPHYELLVGDFKERPYNLPASSNIYGTVSVTQAPSNETGDIRFLVFDTENYQNWISQGQASSLYSMDNQGQFNFTFKTDKSGVYHFVFDNTASVYKKYVVLTIAYNEVSTSRVPDVRANYVGWVTLVAGGLITAYGLIRKPAVTWA